MTQSIEANKAILNILLILMKYQNCDVLSCKLSSYVIFVSTSWEVLMGEGMMLGHNGKP